MERLILLLKKNGIYERLNWWLNEIKKENCTIKNTLITNPFKRTDGKSETRQHIQLQKCLDTPENTRLENTLTRHSNYHKATRCHSQEPLDDTRRGSNTALEGLTEAFTMTHRDRL